MNGKQHFYDCCKELGVDCDALFKIGQQNPRNQTRFVYTSDHTKRTPSQKFAVCYFPDEGIYIAWNLNAPLAKGKNRFSLLKKEVRPLGDMHILPVVKSIEYACRGQETVYVFRPEYAKEFIQAHR